MTNGTSHVLIIVPIVTVEPKTVVSDVKEKDTYKIVTVSSHHVKMDIMLNLMITLANHVTLPVIPVLVEPPPAVQIVIPNSPVSSYTKDIVLPLAQMVSTLKEVSVPLVKILVVLVSVVKITNVPPVAMVCYPI